MNMKYTIAVFGTFDTKGMEFKALTQIIQSNGFDVITIDTGLWDNSWIAADYIIRKMIPGFDNEGLRKISEKTAELLSLLQKEKKIAGVISMGGGQGTFIAGCVFRRLPIGFPKVMLSTIALIESSAAQFKHMNDTVVLNSLVDIAGVNSLLMQTMVEAAGCICGMVVATEKIEISSKKAVGISAWGVTTPCVNEICKCLEKNDTEAYVFHSNGEGGAILEKLIKQGKLAAVADITLSEITMKLAGSNIDTVEDRLENCGKEKIGRVIAPGGIDMILAKPADIEKGGKFYGHKVYHHNPEVIFVRSNKEENLLFAEKLSEKINKTIAPVSVLLPLKGVSAVDKKDEIFFDSETDGFFFETLKQRINNPLVQIKEVPAHINDIEFSNAIWNELCKFL